MIPAGPDGPDFRAGFDVERVEPFLHLALPFEVLVHIVVRHLLAEARVDLVELFEERDGLRDGLLNRLAHGLRLVKARLLFEVADRVARRENRLAREALVRARDDAQERRLPRAVQTYDAYLRAVEV